MGVAFCLLSLYECRLNLLCDCPVVIVTCTLLSQCSFISCGNNNNCLLLINGSAFKSNNGGGDWGVLNNGGGAWGVPNTCLGSISRGTNGLIGILGKWKGSGTVVVLIGGLILRVLNNGGAGGRMIPVVFIFGNTEFLDDFIKHAISCRTLLTPGKS